MKFASIVLCMLVLPFVYAHAGHGLPADHDANETGNNTTALCLPGDPIDRTYVNITAGLVLVGAGILAAGVFLNKKKQRMIRIACFIIGGVSLVASGVVAYSHLEINADSIRFGSPGSAHEHADFQIVINDQLVDLTNDYYMSYKGHDRSRYVHMHEPDYIVHKHATGVTWDYFFKTLNITMDDSCIMVRGSPVCNATFLINELPVPTLKAEIHDGDRALFYYGSGGDPAFYFPYVVGNNSCIPSGTCPERGIVSGCSVTP